MTRPMRNLREMERTREQYWLRHPGTSPTKLRWRALRVRHAFHVLPGEAGLLVLRRFAPLDVRRFEPCVRAGGPFLLLLMPDGFDRNWTVPRSAPRGGRFASWPSPTA